MQKTQSPSYEINVIETKKNQQIGAVNMKYLLSCPPTMERVFYNKNTIINKALINMKKFGRTSIHILWDETEVE